MITTRQPDGHPDASAYSIPSLDAKQLHRTALRAFRLGNRGRLRLCEMLRSLHESRQYLELGCPSIVAYAAKYYRFCRTETYDAIRVATAVENLPGCRQAFLKGKTDWSALKEITRVATAATEQEWLAFAAGHTNAHVRAEVQDAIEKGRDRPRNDRFGLPNLTVKLVVRLSRSEHHKIRTALETLVPEISERLAGRPVDLKDVLIFLAERLLAGGTGAIGGKAGGVDAGLRHTVLYHYCPGCRRARMASEEGMVEVSPDEVERIEGEARRESLDAPTPPPLRRRILLRDGTRCSNPSCTHPADHCHHIVQRSQGGATAVWNETALCSTCHALVHAGLLRITGNPQEGLHWSTRADRAASEPTTAQDLQTQAPSEGNSGKDEVSANVSGRPDSGHRDGGVQASGSEASETDHLDTPHPRESERHDTDDPPAAPG